MSPPSPAPAPPGSPATAALPTAVPARPGAGHLPPLDTHYDKDRHRRRAPLAWLPLALVLALLALLGLALLAAATAGGDDSTTAPGRTSGAAAASRGTLTAGSTDVLQDAGTLSRFGSLAGQRATGEGVLVQQVVSDEGFWVGASSSERVFVHLTEAARGTGESPFRVEAGQRVDLSGEVARLSGGAADLGVTDAEGAAQLEAQRAYVAATRISLSS